MIPTPDLSHLTSQDFDKVYEPAGIFLNHCLAQPSAHVGLIIEDTFLLLDALEQDESWLRSLRPTICLEIG